MRGTGSAAFNNGPDFTKFRDDEGNIIEESESSEEEDVGYADGNVVSCISCPLVETQLPEGADLAFFAKLSSDSATCWLAPPAPPKNEASLILCALSCGLRYIFQHLAQPDFGEFQGVLDEARKKRAEEEAAHKAKLRAQWEAKKKKENEEREKLLKKIAAEEAAKAKKEDISGKTTGLPSRAHSSAWGAVV